MTRSQFRLGAVVGLLLAPLCLSSAGEAFNSHTLTSAARATKAPRARARKNTGAGSWMSRRTASAACRRWSPAGSTARSWWPP